MIYETNARAIRTQSKKKASARIRNKKKIRGNISEGDREQGRIQFFFLPNSLPWVFLILKFTWPAGDPIRFIAKPSERFQQNRIRKIWKSRPPEMTSNFDYYFPQKFRFNVAEDMIFSLLGLPTRELKFQRSNHF